MIYIFKNSWVFRKKTTTGIFSHGGEGHRLSWRLSSMVVKGNGTTIWNHEICSISISWFLPCVHHPWLDQKNLSSPAQKFLPSPAGSTSDIMTSDHSPVFATFEAGVTSQFVSKNGKLWGSVCPSLLHADRRAGHLSSGCSNQLSALDKGSSFQASPWSARQVPSCPNRTIISVQSVFFLSLASVPAS